ncbi:unnamed protein product [Lactuca virosa]|uniref:Protein kinase domain-containing protein n=1 Tax=Lactuca virosa TaxID=75947 RepID=A0AAU9MB82_9ASTR|nr:unnamed protein product [Lactuca virosa]
MKTREMRSRMSESVAPRDSWKFRRFLKNSIGGCFHCHHDCIRLTETSFFWKVDSWSLGMTATEMAKGELSLADLRPMREIFIIPRESQPKV